MRGWPGVGEWELAEDTGLARSAYISSESALRTELLLDEAEETEDTLLTLRDLQQREDKSLGIIQRQLQSERSEVMAGPLVTSQQTSGIIECQENKILLQNN